MQQFSCQKRVKGGKGRRAEKAEELEEMEMMDSGSVFKASDILLIVQTSAIFIFYRVIAKSSTRLV